MILVKHYIQKYENVLKFTFHGFAAHLKGFVSERKSKEAHIYRFAFFSVFFVSEVFLKWIKSLGNILHT